MPLNLIRQRVRNRLWTLATTDPDFLACFKGRTRNFAKVEGVTGNVVNLAARSDTIDFPKFRITDGRWTDSGFTDAASFAQENPDFLDSGEDWPLRMSMEFVLELEHNPAFPADEDTTEEALHAALLKGGPRLANTPAGYDPLANDAGESVVQSWTLAVNRNPDRLSRSPQDSPRPLLSTFRWSGVLQITGRELIG